MFYFTTSLGSLTSLSNFNERMMRAGSLVMTFSTLEGRVSAHECDWKLQLCESHQKNVSGCSRSNRSVQHDCLLLLVVMKNPVWCWASPTKSDFAQGSQLQFIEKKLNAVIEDACDKYYKIIWFKMSNQPRGNN